MKLLLQFCLEMSSINIESKEQLQKIAKIIYLDFSNLLEDNLNNKLILSITNLISLDYIYRLKSRIDVHQYSQTCSKRIKNHLGYKVVLEEDFSTAMSLFIMAITIEPNDENILFEQNIDIIIDTIINAQYAHLDIEETKNIKLSLKSLLEKINKADLINYIDQNPKIFDLNIKFAIKNKQNILELINIVQEQIQIVLLEKNKINNNITSLKGFFSKIMIAASVAVSAILGSTISPILMPLLIVPTTGASIKYAPKIGEKIAKIMPKVKKNLMHYKNNLKQIHNNLNLEVTDELAIGIEESIEQSVAQQAKEILNNIETVSNQTIETAQTHVNKIEEKKQDAVGMTLKK